MTLASGATDAAAKLWSGDGKLLRTLTGHSDRLGRIAFHPMGRHLGGWVAGWGACKGLTQGGLLNRPPMPPMCTTALHQLLLLTLCWGLW